NPPTEILGRRHREAAPAVRPPEVAGVDELSIRVVHSFEHVREPADAGLGKHDLEARMTLERAREDHGRERLVDLQRGAGNAHAHVAEVVELRTARHDGTEPTAEMEAERDARLRSAFPPPLPPPAPHGPLHPRAPH